MAIWQQTLTPAELTALNEGRLAGIMGIRFTEVGDDYLVATMPVRRENTQPYGVLHGGASVVLAETIASVGAQLAVDSSLKVCFGQEINANHLRKVDRGIVTATARPWHLGRSSHVWHVQIADAEGRLSCISRVTMAIVDR
ncbi:MAG: hotdog fold thioesterase [Steroidobacteraceae bacterium]